MKNNISCILIQLSGLIIFSIGSLTVIGYAVNKPTLYTWTGNASMALGTAIAFIFTGIALYEVGDKLKKQ